MSAAGCHCFDLNNQHQLCKANAEQLWIETEALDKILDTLLAVWPVHFLLFGLFVESELKNSVSGMILNFPEKFKQ